MLACNWALFSQVEQHHRAVDDSDKETFGAASARLNKCDCLGTTRAVPPPTAAGSNGGWASNAVPTGREKRASGSVAAGSSRPGGNVNAADPRERSSARMVPRDCAGPSGTLASIFRSPTGGTTVAERRERAGDGGAAYDGERISHPTSPDPFAPTGDLSRDSQFEPGGDPGARSRPELVDDAVSIRNCSGMRDSIVGMGSYSAWARNAPANYHRVQGSDDIAAGPRLLVHNALAAGLSFRNSYAPAANRPERAASAVGPMLHQRTDGSAGAPRCERISRNACAIGPCALSKWHRALPSSTVSFVVQSKGEGSGAADANPFARP